MTTPTLSRNIVISVVLALAAAVALVLYTNNVQDSARSSGDAVRVVVVTRDIRAGTPVDTAAADGDLAYRTVRRSDLVPGAYTDLNAARGLIVLQPVYHGDQLTASRTGVRHDQTVAARLTGNQRAIRLPVDPNSGMTGDIHAGDHVDVLASYTLESNQIETYVLAAGALVMDVTPAAAAQAGDPSAQGSILLRLTEHQVSYLANALANSDGAPGSGSKTIWVAVAGTHGATWEKHPPVVLPGAFPKNGVPSK
ncbi:MAG TPA: Flp pilus assembly protein CpaB [Gaiellales bacterium]|nr:Flp pilus assembly protein CpaB [Gaiellales bacterium]